MKIRLLGAEFHESDRTDVTKLTVAFHNFVNAPNNDMKVRGIRSYCINIFDVAFFLEKPGSFGMDVSL